VNACVTVCHPVSSATIAPSATGQRPTHDDGEHHEPHTHPGQVGRRAVLTDPKWQRRQSTGRAHNAASHANSAKQHSAQPAPNYCSSKPSKRQYERATSACSKQATASAGSSTTSTPDSSAPRDVMPLVPQATATRLLITNTTKLVAVAAELRKASDEKRRLLLVQADRLLDERQELRGR
jgi:hypothetical protein